MDYLKVIGEDSGMSLNQAKLRAEKSNVDATIYERKGMFRDIHEFKETIDLIAIFCRLCARAAGIPSVGWGLCVCVACVGRAGAAGCVRGVVFPSPPLLG